MSLVIQLENNHKELAPTGLQPAVAVDIIDVGIITGPFGDQHKLSIIFELEATGSDGNHFILSKRYTKSLHPKSNLRADLDRWRGQPFSDEDLQEGFDLNKIVGQPCMLYLEKRDNFIAIESILPADPEQVHHSSGNYTRLKDR